MDRIPPIHEDLFRQVTTPLDEAPRHELRQRLEEDYAAQRTSVFTEHKNQNFQMAVSASVNSVFPEVRRAGTIHQARQRYYEALRLALTLPLPEMKDSLKPLDRRLFNIDELHQELGAIGGRHHRLFWGQESSDNMVRLLVALGWLVNTTDRNIVGVWLK